ncbi:MAG: hypothetical protein J6A01_09060 [Proteobacteria bacterium]|nr:hypothetical protein [Pseudomonadota bacterium]
MQILCPHCNDWIDTNNGKCPICGGDPFSDLAPQTNKKKEPTEEDKKRSEENKKRLSHTIKLISAAIVILGTFFVVIGVLNYNKNKEEIEKDSPKVLFKGPENENIYKRENAYQEQACLYPFDIRLIALDDIPSNTDADIAFVMQDEATHLKKQQDMYNEHITRHECQSVDIYQKIGKKKVKLNNDAGWHSYSISSSSVSAMRGFEGCYGRSIGPNTDSLSLYIRKPDADNKSQFIITKGATHYFELGSIYTAIPVADSPILYGFDNDTFSQSKLKKISDTYYSFDVDTHTYAEMFRRDKFRIVMQIKDRKGNRYIIHRIYPLTKEFIVEGEYSTPKPIIEACTIRL